MLYCQQCGQAYHGLDTFFTRAGDHFDLFLDLKCFYQRAARSSLAELVMVGSRDVLSLEVTATAHDSGFLLKCVLQPKTHPGSQLQRQVGLWPVHLPPCTFIERPPQRDMCIVTTSIQVLCHKPTVEKK